MARSTRKPRRSSPRPVWAVLAGAVTVLLIGGFIYFSENAYNGVPLLHYRTLYVQMPTVGHLQQHDPVEIAGTRVGQVLRTTTRNNHAVVELQMEGVGPIPTGSQAVVRADGLLGARYVELDPSSSRTMLANGATITETNPLTTYTWGVPEALNLFDAKTRTALGNMVNGLGQGLEGRGTQINGAIHVGSESGADFDNVAYAILSRPGAAQALLPSSSAGFSALNQSAATLTQSFDPMATSAQAFVQQRSATEQTISELPGAETDIEAGFSGTTGMKLWSSLIDLSKSLAPVLPKAPAALTDVSGFLQRGQSPLTEVKPVLNSIPRASSSTLATLSKLNPDLSPVKSALTGLTNPVTQLAEHGCDIQSFATGVDGLVSYGTVPGGNWGPDDGFPIGVVASPNEVDNQVNTGLTFANTSGYDPPCAFSPGLTLSQTTLLNTLAGSVQP